MTTPFLSSCLFFSAFMISINQTTIFTLSYSCITNSVLLLLFFFPGLHEFEAQKNHEVDEFRAKMRAFCEEKAQERQMLPWLQWMEYNFPCVLEPCCSPVDCGDTKSKNTKIFINVKFEACDVSQSATALFLNRLLLLFKADQMSQYGTALTTLPLWEPNFKAGTLWRPVLNILIVRHVWKSPPPQPQYQKGVKCQI